MSLPVTPAATLALALAAALAALAAPAAASPPRPADLRVLGGDAWHPDNRFALDWIDPAASTPPLTLTHYRIRNPQGAQVAEGLRSGVEEGLTGLAVPSVPGTYAAEVWFEDAAGAQGPVATAQLRFDDTRPAAIVPGPVPTWIGRTAIPLRLRLGHPSGPQPPAGIRGYAVAIDSRPNGSPCAASDRCTDAETDLRGGIDDDELEVVALPEGTSYLHAVAVSGSGMRSPSAGHAVLHVDTVDPLTRLAGAPAGWTSRAVPLSARAVDADSGMEQAGGPSPFTAIRVDDGAPVIGFDHNATTNVIGEGVHRVAYYARDAAGNVNDGAEQNGIANRSPGIAWVRIDRTPPRLAFTNSQDPGDPDLVRVRIVDPLSGPDLSRGWIGVRPAGSGNRFEPLPPAPPGRGELRARWSSDAHPAGEYEFLAVGYDTAGNASRATRRRDGAAMVLANPLKATTTLWGSFNRRVLSRAVPYGRRVLLRGRLTTGLSSPLAGLPVRIVERFAPGARPGARVSTIRTGPGGSFSLRTAAGPSRTIAVGFEGSPTLSRTAGPTLELRVRSRVRLRASAGVARVGGAPLVLRGRVAAAPGTIPPAGRSVQLQFRLPGLPWSEFRTVETDRRGRFRLAYRFSDDDSRGARFQFRAYVPPQDGWPYEPASSRPIVVQGL